MKNKLLIIAALLMSTVGQVFCSMPLDTQTNVSLEQYLYMAITPSYGKSNADLVLDKKQESLVPAVLYIIGLYAPFIKPFPFGQNVVKSKIDNNTLARYVIKSGELFKYMQQAADKCHWGDTSTILTLGRCIDVGCYVGQKIHEFEQDANLRYLALLQLYNCNVVNSSYHDKASVRLILGLY